MSTVIPAMELSFKRASPIGVEARDHLVKLINQEEALHSKSTEGKMVVLKRQAWARVTARFNAQGFCAKKTDQQLMKIWERVKAKTKNNKPERRKPEEVPVDSHTASDLPMTEDELDPLQQEWDSDQGYLNQTVVVNVGLAGEECLPSLSDEHQRDSEITGSENDWEAAGKQKSREANEVSPQNPSLPDIAIVTNMEDGKDQEEDNVVLGKTQRRKKTQQSFSKNCSTQGSECDTNQPPKEPTKPFASAYYIVRKHPLDENKKEEKAVDPTDLFFQSVAATVKRFNPYFLNLCKRKIFSVVSEFEMKQILGEGSPPASTVPKPAYTTEGYTLPDRQSPSLDSVHSEDTLELKCEF